MGLKYQKAHPRPYYRVPRTDSHGNKQYAVPFSHLLSFVRLQFDAIEWLNILICISASQHTVIRKHVQRWKGLCLNCLN